MSELKFYTANGFLTRYALACGYVEKTETDLGRITLGMESPGSGVFHIKGFINGEHLWDVAESLTEARAIYRRHSRTLHP